MSAISEGLLLGGKSFKYEKICTLKPTKVEYIRDPILKNGYERSLSVLMSDTESIINALKIQEAYDKATQKEKRDFTVFNILALYPETRLTLASAIEYFTEETPLYNEGGVFAMASKKDGSVVGRITNDNFTAFCDGIRQLNCLGEGKAESKELVFKDEEARRVYEKIYGKGGAKTAVKANPDLEIENVVSAVCAKHQSYNLLNVWDLTVYQLYDQFSRLALNYSVDVIAAKWAAWGTTEFELNDSWYKSKTKKGETNK